MRIRPHIASAFALIIVAAFLPPKAHAQGHIEASIEGPATVVDRSTPLPGRSIITQTGQAALLLSDTSIVIEMTDEGLASLTKEKDPQPSHGVSGILTSMVKAGITGMLDRGMSYPLAKLDRAKAEGTRIYLFDRDGKLVFDNVKLNETIPMRDFAPEDAKAFAKKINSAIKRNRS